MSRELSIREATADDAAEVLEIIHESFRGRPALDPPSTALGETLETVRAALTEESGLIGFLDDQPVAALLLRPQGASVGLRRVGVVPAGRGVGAGQALAVAAEEWAGDHGYAELRLTARAELPATVRFWQRRGYVALDHPDQLDRSGPEITLAKPAPLRFAIPDAERSQEIGRRLGAVLRAGDLVILTGDLGAGKTTLTQGIGDGLGVRGPITSPTFVIARVHPTLVSGPALVHVDAYRLGDHAELDDLDLDTDLDLAVTVVEWGAGLAEVLAADRLEIELDRRTPASGGESDRESDRGAGTEARTGVLRARGSRWLGVDLRSLVG